MRRPDSWEDGGGGSLDRLRDLYAIRNFRNYLLALSITISSLLLYITS